jgi:hypothetical protein
MIQSSILTRLKVSFGMDYCRKMVTTWVTAAARAVSLHSINKKTRSQRSRNDLNSIVYTEKSGLSSFSMVSVLPFFE